jgi:hypothetical protein
MPDSGRGKSRYSMRPIRFVNFGRGIATTRDNRIATSGRLWNNHLR